MENKFSKGKWRISNYGAFIESENGVIAAVSLSTQENINNAKLIAAAPELLEALIALVNGCLSDSESDKVVSLRKAKEVIKKAIE